MIISCDANHRSDIDKFFIIYCSPYPISKTLYFYTKSANHYPQ